MILLTIWAYLIVGVLVSYVYRRKFFRDVERGNPRAIRLQLIRDSIGESKFWNLFYALTMLMYGVFLMHAVLSMFFPEEEEC